MLLRSPDNALLSSANWANFVQAKRLTLSAEAESRLAGCLACHPEGIRARALTKLLNAKRRGKRVHDVPASLLFAASCASETQRVNTPYASSELRRWILDRSLVLGTAAKAFAEVSFSEDAEAAANIGLFLGTGIAMMWSIHGRFHEQLLTEVSPLRTESFGESLAMRESHHYGYSHVSMATIVAGWWGMPDTVQRPLRLLDAENPILATSTSVARLADRFATFCERPTVGRLESLLNRRLMRQMGRNRAMDTLRQALATADVLSDVLQDDTPFTKSRPVVNWLIHPYESDHREVS